MPKRSPTRKKRLPASLKSWTEEDRELNHFAIRSFRDVADADYIAARLAYRAQLPVQFLWASQQALEKYLKFILFLERVKAPEIKHYLAPALQKLEAAGLTLDLTEGSKKFITQIDRVGRFRYMEVSIVVEWHWVMALDRAVWELRRFCTSDPFPRSLKLIDGQWAPRYQISDGYLEKVLANKDNPARKYLLSHNAFWGRGRKKVTIRGSFIAMNSPLFLKPELVDTLRHFVLVPAEVATAYRKLAAERAQAKKKR